jgi:hypothetical protein
MVSKMGTQMTKVAVTPPMGWNSWDCYGASVNEEEIRGNAEYMATHLKQFGWEYIVVDIQWYEPGAYSHEYRSFTELEMDEYSRLMPAVNRFPSAEGGKGFKPLSDYVHDLGLKFGIHIMRGIPRQAVHRNTPILGTTATARQIAHPNSICPWNTDMYGVDCTKEGAQQYYNSLFELYAKWGVDFVKVDDIAASRLYGIHDKEIEMIRKAINHCGRPMVLSLSPGPAPREEAELLTANANMWRMTDDFWDSWRLLADMFERCEKWEGISGEGNWPDCDMLPLGNIRVRTHSDHEPKWSQFTQDEQVTMMTLWSIFRSPLFFGGELRNNDEWTLKLITNPEVIRVTTHSRQNKQVYRTDSQAIWTARDEDGSIYVAMFNLSEQKEQVKVSFSELGLVEDANYAVRDLWLREDVGTKSEVLQVELAAHGAGFFKLASQ